MECRAGGVAATGKFGPPHVEGGRCFRCGGSGRDPRARPDRSPRGVRDSPPSGSPSASRSSQGSTQRPPGQGGGVSPGPIKVSRAGKRFFAWLGHLFSTEGTFYTKDELEALATDPAIGYKINAKTIAERDAALGLQAAGKLPPGELLRDSVGGGAADFEDAGGQLWDVKTYNSNFRNGFSPKAATDEIQENMDTGENVILDTRNLSQSDLTTLQKIVGLHEAWIGHILWWPIDE